MRLHCACRAKNNVDNFPSVETMEVLCQIVQIYIEHFIVSRIYLKQVLDEITIQMRLTLIFRVVYFNTDN